MRGISNWWGENFIGWWAADFQIYVLRFPSAKHSDEPLKAGIVFSKGFHDSWVSSPLPRREPEYIYLEIRLFNGIELFFGCVGICRKRIDGNTDYTYLRCTTHTLCECKPVNFLFGALVSQPYLSSNAKIPPHQISFPMRWFLFLLHCFYRSRHFFFILF